MIYFMQYFVLYITFHRCFGEFTGFVTRLTRRVALVEQELPTLLEHLGTPTVFNGFLLLELQFYVYVQQIVVCPFGHCVVCSSDYPFDIFKLFAPFWSTSVQPLFQWGSYYSILCFMCLFYRSLFVLFLLVVILSVLRFTDSDYPIQYLQLSFYITEHMSKRVSCLTILDQDVLGKQINVKIASVKQIVTFLQVQSSFTPNNILKKYFNKRQRKPKRQSRMDNPEKMATLGTKIFFF